MIEQKHSFNKNSYKVREKFVDRIKAKQLYRDKLNNNKKDYNVLLFYGIGGIGKTSLRKEICRIHKEENLEGISFYLDLNAQEDRNLGVGILKLVDSCNVKIDFKCFELAYALYFRKKNPGVQYGRSKEMIVDNPFVDIGLNILGIFDSGIVGTAAEIVERTLRVISNRVIDKEVKEELKNFDNHSIAEMEEMLPLFFQYDLKSYLNKHKNTKVLMVIDSFEALNENVIEQIHKSKNERWIQEIIEYFDAKQFPNLLITIFGRDKITWNEEWSNIIEQYKLEEFEENFSKEYLKEAKIEDDEIINAIIKSSNGYPFLLYLSLETYVKIKNKGKEPTKEDFVGNYPKIIERFIYNLDKDSVEVLRLMSIPNFYNVDIFRMLIGKFNVSFPMTEFDQFNKYSFVSKDMNGHDYYIHELMRRGIQEKSSKRTIKEAHEHLLDYYVSRISNNINTRDILEMFYHARKSMEVKEFNNWLQVKNKNDISPLDIMKIQQKKGEQSILMQMINGIKSDYDVNDMLIDFINIYIDVVHLGGSYDEAVHICERYLKRFSNKEIVSNEQLIKMRIRKIHHSMFYIPVDELISEAKDLLSKIDIKKYPEQYNEILFLLGGNLGVLSGQFDIASEWLEMSISYAKKNNLDLFVQRTIRKQADIMLAKDDCEGALNLLTTFVKPTSGIEEINNRYKIYLMGSLGEIYRKKGDLESAWECFDIVDKKSTENYMPGWQAHAFLAKGMIEIGRTNYLKAGKMFDLAYTIYSRIHQQWGIINTEQARMLLKNIQGIKIKKEEIDNNLAIATRMNYRYNIQYANNIMQGKSSYLQLFFL